MWHMFDVSLHHWVTHNCTLSHLNFYILHCFMHLHNWWSQRLQIWCTCWMCKSQGRGQVMWPIARFWGSSHITGAAEPKVVKFCTRVGYINSSRLALATGWLITNKRGRGYGHVTVLKFCHSFWCSASRWFVSDSWAACLSIAVLGTEGIPACAAVFTFPMCRYRVLLVTCGVGVND